MLRTVFPVISVFRIECVSEFLYKKFIALGLLDRSSHIKSLLLDTHLLQIFFVIKFFYDRSMEFCTLIVSYEKYFFRFKVLDPLWITYIFLN